MNFSSRVGVDRLGRHGGNNNGSASVVFPAGSTPTRAAGGEWLPIDIGVGSSGGSGGGASSGCG